MVAVDAYFISPDQTTYIVSAQVSESESHSYAKSAFSNGIEVAIDNHILSVPSHQIIGIDVHSVSIPPAFPNPVVRSAENPGIEILENATWKPL